MPRKFRLIESEIKEIAARKTQFESELTEAGSDLERLQISVVKGTVGTDSFASAQMRVNAIEQMISVVDSRLAALDADLILYRNLEKKREIISKIKLLDDEAEKLGSRFFSLYSNVEKLTYVCFAEMALIIARQSELKTEFGSFIFKLIPGANELKYKVLPQLQLELDNLIAELQDNHCKLSVLRASKVFSSHSYPMDSEHAFRLPEIDSRDSEWIWSSIRFVRERERMRNFAVVEKTGIFQKIFSKKGKDD